MVGILLGGTNCGLGSRANGRVDLGSSDEDIVNDRLVLLEHGSDALGYERQSSHNKEKTYSIVNGLALLDDNQVTSGGLEGVREGCGSAVETESSAGSMCANTPCVWGGRAYVATAIPSADLRIGWVRLMTGAAMLYEPDMVSCAFL